MWSKSREKIRTAEAGLLGRFISLIAMTVSRKHIITILFLPLLFCTAGYGQLFNDYNFNVRSYTTSQGLVHNSVKKCLSDSRGFLWIITENGLSRFDGFQFSNYQHRPGDSTSLPENNLTDIAITAGDDIYLAYQYGLCHLELRTGRFTIIKKDGTNVAAERIVYDKNNNCLYIGTRKGLLKYDLKQQKLLLTGQNTTAKNILTGMTLDRQGYIWTLVERHGYFRYDTRRDTAYYYDSFDWPTSLYQGTDGTYYLGTWGSGFQVFDGLGKEHNKEVSHLKLSDVPGTNYIYCSTTEAPLLTGDDILWVAGNTSGIGLYSKSQKKFIHHINYAPQLKNGVTTPFNWSLYTAPDGSLWVCSWHGLMKVSRQNMYFQSGELPELNSGLYNAVTGIIDDPYEKDIAWVAVIGNGLARYRKSTNTIEQRYYFDQTAVSPYYLERWPLGFLKDSAQTIWSASYGGLIRIRNGKVSFIPLSDSGRYAYTQATYSDKQGHIWALGQMVFEFDPHTEKYQSWPFPMTGARSFGGTGMAEGPDGMYYLSSYYGLFTLNKKTGKTGSIPFNATLPDKDQWAFVKAIACIDSVIYIGGAPGLAAYDSRTGKTMIVAPGSNIKQVTINGLYTDVQKNLWIYCSAGVFRYTPLTGELSQFTSADGIYTHSNDPSYFFSYNGYVYLGSRMAYTRFNPALVTMNTNVPVPYITDAEIGNKQLQWDSGSKQELRFWQNDISFSFTAIEYNFPEKLTFSYFLEGYDKEWSRPSAARTRSYTNLPPGRYTFRVRAYSSQQKAGKTEASFSFTIKPAFWQTAWFKLLVLLFVAGVIWLLYRWRIRQLKQKQARENKLQQLELDQYRKQLELEQMSRFFSESMVARTSAKEVLNDVAKNLIGKMGFDDCMIYLWNDDKTVLVQYTGHGQKGAVENLEATDQYNIPKGKGIVGAAVADGRPVLVQDVTKDRRYITADGIVRGSELCVPLSDEGEIIGAINIEQEQKNYFTSHHLHIVSTIASLLVSKLKAIQSSRSLHEKELELSQASRQLAESEIAMLRSQMNPHFIFNSLNSVQKYIWENKEEDAAEYLASFAKLMRAILENSRHEYIPLSREVEFLKLYISLENRRSNNSFNYMVQIDEALLPEEISIPPMILQPFIENAIWHGLNKKKEKGNLLILIRKENEELVCVVDDDGVGRGTTKEPSAGKKSLGISITRQRIERLMENTHRKASVNIRDKMKDGLPAGTEVTVILPLQKKPHA